MGLQELAKAYDEALAELTKAQAKEMAAKAAVKAFLSGEVVAVAPASKTGSLKAADYKAFRKKLWEAMKPGKSYKSADLPGMVSYAGSPQGWVNKVRTPLKDAGWLTKEGHNWSRVEDAKGYYED